MSPDKETRFVDQNTDRNPGTPLEALVLAVQKSQPEFDFTEIDIVTDRRPIRKLYGFVTGELIPFRFGVTIIGNTALFTRMENNTRDELATSSFQGYREAFETAYTKTVIEARGSTSHHRILDYDLGGLRFLVRYAVDAFFEHKARELMHKDGSEPLALTKLVKNLRASTLDDVAPTPSRWDYALRSSVRISSGGRSIPHAATIEMSTKSEWSRQQLNGTPLQRKLADLWIAQTPNYIEAFHKPQTHGHKGSKSGNWRLSAPLPEGRLGPAQAVAKSKPRLDSSGDVGLSKGLGSPKESRERQTVFTSIVVHDMPEKLTEWESSHGGEIQKLVTTVKRIIEAAKKCAGSCIVKYNGEKDGVLEVAQTEDGSDLPTVTKYLRNLFISKQGDSGNSNSPTMII